MDLTLVPSALFCLTYQIGSILYEGWNIPCIAVLSLTLAWSSFEVPSLFYCFYYFWRARFVNLHPLEGMHLHFAPRVHRHIVHTFFLKDDRKLQCLPSSRLPMYVHISDHYVFLLLPVVMMVWSCFPVSFQTCVENLESDLDLSFESLYLLLFLNGSFWLVSFPHLILHFGFCCSHVMKCDNKFVLANNVHPNTTDPGIQASKSAFDDACADIFPSVSWTEYAASLLLLWCYSQV